MSPCISFRYIRQRSVGTRSPTQLFRYAGVSRAHQEGCAGRAAARAREAASDRYRGQQAGDDRPAVRRFQASVRALPAGGGPVFGMGSYPEAAPRCGKRASRFPSRFFLLLSFLISLNYIFRFSLELFSKKKYTGIRLRVFRSLLFSIVIPFSIMHLFIFLILI